MDLVNRTMDGIEHLLATSQVQNPVLQNLYLHPIKLQGTVRFHLLISALGRSDSSASADQVWSDYEECRLSAQVAFFYCSHLR